MRKTKQQPATFEDSLGALEKVVRELERGDLPLEDSLKLFEDGVRLSRECQERLTQAERRIEILLRDGDGKPILKALENEDDEPGATDDEFDDDDELDETDDAAF